jgi:hypothetical protein
MMFKMVAILYTSLGGAICSVVSCLGTSMDVVLLSLFALVRNRETLSELALLYLDPAIAITSVSISSKHSSKNTTLHDIHVSE